jgi:hypothetical protein
MRSNRTPGSAGRRKAVAAGGRGSLHRAGDPGLVERLLCNSPSCALCNPPFAQVAGERDAHKKTLLLLSSRGLLRGEVAIRYRRWKGGPYKAAPKLSTTGGTPASTTSSTPPLGQDDGVCDFLASVEDCL